MRLLIKFALVTGMVFALSSQASAVSVDLVGGPASPLPSDIVSFDIFVTLQGGDSLTLVDPAIQAMGASFISGTEAQFAFVNGVLMTPIGAPTVIFTDIGANTWDGWEAQTLTVGGAPGPAGFSIGTATFHLGGPDIWLTMDTVVGGLGTVVGDGAFQNITGSTTFGNYHIVPEPTTAGLMTLGLIGLVVAGRRR